MEELGRNFEAVGLVIWWNFVMVGLRNLSKMVLFAHFGGQGELQNFFYIENFIIF